MFAEDIIFYTENSKDCTQKLAELVRKFSKFIDADEDGEKALLCV
jgi:hypothetical protein